MREGGIKGGGGGGGGGGEGEREGIKGEREGGIDGVWMPIFPIIGSAI